MHLTTAQFVIVVVGLLGAVAIFLICAIARICRSGAESSMPKEPSGGGYGDGMDFY